MKTTKELRVGQAQIVAEIDAAIAEAPRFECRFGPPAHAFVIAYRKWLDSYDLAHGPKKYIEIKYGSVRYRLVNEAGRLERFREDILASYGFKIVALSQPFDKDWKPNPNWLPPGRKLPTRGPRPIADDNGYCGE